MRPWRSRRGSPSSCREWAPGTTGSSSVTATSHRVPTAAGRFASSAAGSPGGRRRALLWLDLHCVSDPAKQGCGLPPRSDCQRGDRDRQGQQLAEDERPALSPVRPRARPEGGRERDAEGRIRPTAVQNTRHQANKDKTPGRVGARYISMEVMAIDSALLLILLV